jgi:hypothetical protein
MSSLIRKALSAGIATALLGAAAIAFVPATASAEVLLARSECLGGYWHVITYDATDPDHWVKVSDEPTAQICGGQALFLGFMADLGREVIRADLRHEREDFRREYRQGDAHEPGFHMEARTGRK